MTAEYDVDRRIAVWLDASAPARAPDGLAAATSEQVARTPQRPTPVRVAIRPLHPVFSAVAAAAGVVAILLASSAFDSGRQPSPPPGASAPAVTSSLEPAPSPTVAGSPDGGPTPTGSVLIKGWPGGAIQPAGTYSWKLWEGRRWMHHVFDSRVQVSLEFSLTAENEPSPSGTLFVGGFRANRELFPVASDGTRVERWLIDVDGTAVSIRMEASPDARLVHRAEAYAVIESIRLDQGPGRRPRLVFDLPAGWDSG